MMFRNAQCRKLTISQFSSFAAVSIVAEKRKGAGSWNIYYPKGENRGMIIVRLASTCYLDHFLTVFLISWPQRAAYLDVSGAKTRAGY